MDQNSQPPNDDKQQAENKTPKLITRLGIDEEVYVRTSKKGRYHICVTELEELILNDELTRNDLKLLYYIKSRTINFRNTELKIKRKDLQEALGITRSRFMDSLKRLTEKEYLIEKPDKDHYYLYGLNPYKFDGLIVLRSPADSVTKINRALKPAELLATYAKKKAADKDKECLAARLEWCQKASALVSKWDSNECIKLIENMYQIDRKNVSFWDIKMDLSDGNYSPSEILKYTLLKYTYLNSLSAPRGQKILEILEGIPNPEYGIKQLVALIHQRPYRIGAITEELLRAHREKQHAITKQTIRNELIYIVSEWDAVKSAYAQYQDTKIDMTPELVEFRNDIAALVAEFPILENKPAKVIDIHKKQQGGAG
jgi:hypothetical protein